MRIRPLTSTANSKQQKIRRKVSQMSLTMQTFKKQQEEMVNL